MKTRRLAGLAIAAVLLYGAIRFLTGGGGPMPGLFAGVSYEDARARAEREGKLLVADYKAAWCGPCRLMDRTTWRDRDLAAWLSQHAIAVEVDVDRHPDLAQAAGATSIPLVVVTRAGDEVARLVGYHDARSVLEALERADRP